jgi:selenocysteine lyase/cysteine desulfurase
VLVAKRELLPQPVPATPGGGTVPTSTPRSTATSTDPEHREEGGTPAIIESIRAGLVFQLKEAVGVETIRAQEDGFSPRDRRLVAAADHPILGNLDARGGCRSCRSSSGTQRRYLHHNFVVALLNDLFGIQARGGCSCAGPYGHRLLGIDLARSNEFEREIINGGCEGIKPGWVRVNFNYFLSARRCSHRLNPGPAAGRPPLDARPAGEGAP